MRTVEGLAGTLALLGARFRHALTWAAELHQHQRRKAGGVPYLAHLLGVCALVAGSGGDEDQAVAALLHDAVEDQGVTIAEIEERYGARVASIVEVCTDSFSEPKLPWRERKVSFLERLGDAPNESLLVVVADKLDNARAILADLRDHGPAVFERFNGGRDGTLWYYRRAADLLAIRFPHRLTQELDRSIAEIEQLAS